jgi:hypothetical protein
MEYLLDFALAIRKPRSECPIMALTVIKDGDHAREDVRQSRNLLNEAIRYVTSFEVPAEAVTRIDMSAANGIVRAIDELAVNELVMGWNAKLSTSEFFFGTTLDKLLRRCFQMVYVLKQIKPLNTNEDIFVTVPKYAHYERGFNQWVDKSVTMAKHLTARLHYFGDGEALSAIHHRLDDMHEGFPAHYVDATVDELVKGIGDTADPYDLLFIVSARKGTLSHTDNVEELPNRLHNLFPKNNSVTIFPTQDSEDRRQSQSIPLTSLPHFTTFKRLKRAILTRPKIK